MMETGDLGEFGVWRRDGDHWVDLVPWTRSDSVGPAARPTIWWCAPLAIG